VSKDQSQKSLQQLQQNKKCMELLELSSKFGSKFVKKFDCYSEHQQKYKKKKKNITDSKFFYIRTVKTIGTVT
jgi:hypothetical protein